MQETKSPAARPKTPPPSKFRLLGRFLASRTLWLTVLAIMAATVVALLLVSAGLNWYTNHGQRLEVKEYVGLTIEAADEAIDDDDFRMAIIDSLYLVDQAPGIVLTQDPPAGSYVKEDRRIYLTVTKSVPDMVTLPPLAGTYDLSAYQRKLSLIDLTGSVKSREYSNRYQPNTILRVFYNDREISEQELRNGYRIARGSNLEFVVSSKDGGEARLPNLRCRTYDEARFLLQSYRLQPGEVEEDATVVHPPSAYVWQQEPPFIPGAALPFDSEVKLFLTQEQPSDCDGI